jgi:hypothetical protein
MHRKILDDTETHLIEYKILSQNIEIPYPTRPWKYSKFQQPKKNTLLCSSSRKKDFIPNFFTIFKGAVAPV